jgi:penicillin-binding protein 1A
MSWILEGVITGGTGRSANIGRPAAGKTGSAQNNADATFVGYTPDRATAVWVGFPQGQIPMQGPNTKITVFGGTYPARIWKGVMEAALVNIPERPFEAPRATTTTSTTLPLGEASPVPGVSGIPLADAQAALSAAGFGITTVEVESDEFPPGTVVNQAPQAGALAPLNSKVTLEVAIAPAADIAVPNVVGLTRNVAQSQLVTAGFNVEAVLEPAPAGTEPAPQPGYVWRQTPAAGSPKPNGPVRISIQT